MYCDNCGSEIDHGARFCEHCGRAITGPPSGAGRVASVQSRAASEAIEGSRKARIWIWVACGAGLLVVLFSARFVVLLCDAISWDVAPSESNVAVVKGSSPSTRAPTAIPSPELPAGPVESDTSRRSFEASKPSIPSSSSPLADPDIYSAVWIGRTVQVRTLVNGSANVNVRNSDNDPLLHGAIWRGHTDIVRILVDAGVDVNASDARGGSPLDSARFWARDDSEIVQILVEAGAEE